jgi:hypothetical protein
MEDLKRAIKDLEESVRHCYEETIPLSSDDFVTIILTDVSFIIELFFRNKFRQYWSSDDKIILKPWLAARMRLDFILIYLEINFLSSLLTNYLTLHFHLGCQDPLHSLR